MIKPIAKAIAAEPGDEWPNISVRRQIANEKFWDLAARRILALDFSCCWS
jgi:hypothetical protein